MELGKAELAALGEILSPEEIEKFKQELEESKNFMAEDLKRRKEEREKAA